MYAPYPHVVTLTSSVLDSLRWYASGSPSVMHAAITLIERVGVRAEDVAVRSALRQHVDLLSAAFRGAGHQSRDVDMFVRRAERVSAALVGAQAPKIS